MTRTIPRRPGPEPGPGPRNTAAVLELVLSPLERASMSLSGRYDDNSDFDNVGTFRATHRVDGREHANPPRTRASAPDRKPRRSSSVSATSPTSSPAAGTSNLKPPRLGGRRRAAAVRQPGQHRRDLFPRRPGGRDQRLLPSTRTPSCSPPRTSTAAASGGAWKSAPGQSQRDTALFGLVHLHRRDPARPGVGCRHGKFAGHGTSPA